GPIAAPAHRRLPERVRLDDVGNAEKFLEKDRRLHAADFLPCNYPLTDEIDDALERPRTLLDDGERLAAERFVGTPTENVGFGGFDEREPGEPARGIRVPG